MQENSNLIPLQWMSPWRERHSRKQFPFFIWLNGFEIALFVWSTLTSQCKPQYAKTFLSINHWKCHSKISLLFFKQCSETFRDILNNNPSGDMWFMSQLNQKWFTTHLTIADLSFLSLNSVRWLLKWHFSSLLSTFPVICSGVSLWVQNN